MGLLCLGYKNIFYAEPHTEMFEAFFCYREIEESGRPRLPWKEEFASSNLAFPTKAEVVGLSPKADANSVR